MFGHNCWRHHERAVLVYILFYLLPGNVAGHNNGNTSSRVLLEKLLVPQLVGIYPHFMKCEGSLPF